MLLQQSNPGGAELSPAGGGGGGAGGGGAFGAALFGESERMRYSAEHYPQDQGRWLSGSKDQ